MKIGGMEATGSAFVKVQNSETVNTNTKDNTNNTNSMIIENKTISQLTEFEKNELPVSEKIIVSAIEKANKAMAGTNKRLEFSVHEKTKEIMVKVINSDTNEVVREFPPEKILDMVAKMWEMAGLMVDERR